VIRDRLAELSARPATDLPLERLGLELAPAAVLLLVWEHAGDGQLLLTRRARSLATQPGDIALPGGRCEPGEEAVDTARREAHEEVGLDPDAYIVMGRFDEAWSSAGSRVVPVVGWAGQPPRLQAAPDEVDEILVLPLVALADDANRSERVTPVARHEYRDSLITVGDTVVVGFTADLVLDLVVWLEGRDRHRVDERVADLAHFAADRGWR